jgi:hypothetical protein
LNDVNEIKDEVIEEIKNVRPSPNKIITTLFNLRIDREGIEFSPKDEWRYIPDIEFFNIVAALFTSGPEFYMKNLYRGIVKRMIKLNGIDKLKDMEKYIIEKYCLYPGETILFDCLGGIQFFENPTLKSRGVTSNGNLYITDSRIIVCSYLFGKGLMAMGGSVSSGHGSRKRIMDHSFREKCYGYIFPIKDLYNLRKTTKNVNYNIRLMGYTKYIRIIVGKSVDRKETINKLFEILSNQSREEVAYPQ